MTQRVRVLEVLIVVSALVAGGCSDEPEAALCAMAAENVRGLDWSLTGMWNSNYQRSQYSGWAVVERSSRHDLVLYVTPKRLARWSDALSTTIDDSEEGGNHAVLSDPVRALPVLPRGHRVWLSSISDRYMYVRPGVEPEARSGDSQITLRTADRGTLLLSRLQRTMMGALDGDAVSFAAPTEVCSQDSSCSNVRDVYYEVTVRADRPLSMRHGDLTQVAIGGNDYTMLLQRAQSQQGEDSVSCGELDARIWLSADIRPTDSSALDAELAPSTLPACALGNDPSLGVTAISLNRVHGEVVLVEKVRGYWLFRDADGSTFELAADAPIPKASVGDRFWLDSETGVFALRASRGSAVLVAGASDDTSGRAVALLGEWLGVTARFATSCLYERSNGERSSPGSNELYELWFDDTPIRAGHSTAVELSDGTYDVWSSGVGPNIEVMVAPSG